MIENFNRRRVLKYGAVVAGALTLHRSPLCAEIARVLELASAGSFRAMLDGPLKAAAAEQLQLDLHTHSGGADAVSQSIVDGSVPADVFIPITAGPMLTVMRAGKARIAYPIARTEMVILYSPRSRFAPQFAEAAAGKRAWWEVLQQPGLNFARSDPANDPSGRAILFTLMLTAAKYHQPDLVGRVFGPVLNPAQIQLGKNLRAGLEDGSIDAAGSYRIATHSGKLPFISLPADVNLSREQVRQEHPELVLNIGEKTFYPEPLVFYAAALTAGTNPEGAARFVDWLKGKDGTKLLLENGFDLPAAGPPLSPATALGQGATNDIVCG